LKLKNLNKRGGEERLEGVCNLILTLAWKSDADLDLCALYDGKDGKIGLVYFGETGDLGAFPYIRLNMDEGLEVEGANYEKLTISKLDDLNHIWIIFWDYVKVESGKPAKFAEAEVSLSVHDSTGNNHVVLLDPFKTGNVCCLAHIDNTSSEGARLVNASLIGTLTGLSSASDLLAICRPKLENREQVLTKGQAMELKDAGGTALTRIAIGLGWGERSKGDGFLSKLFGGNVSVDLDASCIVFDENKEHVDEVWFGKLSNKDGSIVHTGDDLSPPSGVYEVIHVDLDSLPARCSCMMFVINSYSGETFSGIPFAFVNITDRTNDNEIARFTIKTEGKNHKGFIMVELSKKSSIWKLKAIGEPLSSGSRTINELIAEARPYAQPLRSDPKSQIERKLDRIDSLLAEFDSDSWLSRQLNGYAPGVLAKLKAMRDDLKKMRKK